MPFPWLLAAAAAPVAIKAVRGKEITSADWSRLAMAGVSAGISHAANASKAATSATIEDSADKIVGANKELTEVTKPPEVSEVSEVPKETTGGGSGSKDSIAKANGFFSQELIPGTTNAKFLEMAVKGVANKYTLQSTQNACQANIDNHTERYRSKASGNVTRSYDTVMNSGACRGLAATQAKDQGQTPSDMAEILKRYDVATELGNQVDVPGNDGDQASGY